MGSSESTPRPGLGEEIEQAGEQRSARIESLRALAALSVLYGHIVAASLGATQAFGSTPDVDLAERILFGGGLGVFFFFVLSGYLLFWPFVRRDFGGGQPIDLRRYAVNRALRILPLYLVVVVVVLSLHDGGATIGTWLRYLTMTVDFNAQAATLISGLGPLWSVIVEVHFYLLLPLLAWAIGRLSGGSLRRAAALLLLLAAASLAVRMVTIVLPSGQPDPLWRLNIPANFLFFVPGMLLALLRVQWRAGPPGWLRGPLGRADLWILASLPLSAIPVLVSYAYAPLIGVAAFLVVGACVLPLRPGPLLRLLEWRWLAVVGIASYSLYAWHLAIIEVALDVGWSATPWTVLALVVVPVAIAAALLSYRFVEAPILRLRGQWSGAAAAKAAPIEAAVQPAAEGRA